MRVFTAFIAGLVLGIGLLVAGMSNPAKVLGFLDLAGAWDPSLALVMIGAIGVAMPAFALARMRPTTWLGTPLSLPAIGRVDGRLAAGAALFGIGWGLAGICPGPALTLLGSGRSEGVAFVGALLAGMGAHEILRRRG